MLEDQAASDAGESRTRDSRRQRAIQHSPRELSIREAATILERSERTIRRAIASGALTGRKQGSTYRISHDALIRYAESLADPSPLRPLARVVAFPGAREMAPLPEPLSSFIGRSADLAAVLELLEDTTPRLITLTGPGGIGKTRLALAAASAIGKNRFPDGIAFIALADLDCPNMVMPAIAQSLGLRQRPGQHLDEQLRRFLRQQQFLLVLDNFEHLLAAGPEVAALLTEAAKVTALVTSRAPLRVSGERELPVLPMTVAGQDATTAELLASDAGRLFTARAREHDPSYTVDEESAPLISKMCARLDGLPLAIELAAARVRILPPRQLSDRLERRLPLLTRGARNAPARHSTMRDAIAWSYELLSTTEKECFHRLAVFSGGATLEAAAAVCRGATGEIDGSQAAEIVDVIANLTDHSLLLTETGPDGKRRFRMLETIREFGLEQLAAAGNEDDVRALHAQYFLALSRALRPLASTQATYAPFDTLTAEYANLQEALARLDTHGPAAELVALVADLCELWYTSSSNQEARTWVGQAMSKLEQAMPIDQGRLLVGFGAVLMTQGDFAQAEPLLARGLQLLRAAGAALYISRTLILYGGVASVSGRYAEAEAPLLEALALAEELADPDLRAAAAGRALTNLCCAVRGQSDFARAASYSENALRLYEGKSFDSAKGSALVDLGAVAYDAGDHRRALACWLEGIALMADRGDMRQVADALSGIACIAATRDEPRTALLLLGAADALRERVGAAMVWPSDIAAVERCLATLQKKMGEKEVAETLAAGRALTLAESVRIAAALTLPQSVVSPGAPRAIYELTRRELDVLRLVAEHRSDREIAEALFLSRRTVNWHVRSILAKLDAASRGEALSRARAEGLI